MAVNRHFRIVASALWVMLPSFAAHVFAADEEIAAGTIAAATLSTARDDVYTINFNNVSVIEYIRFVAKISKSNFTFDENDLRFNVTIVSEDQATLQDIFSALVQVLRINNLSLLEHEGNYVISRDPNVTQLPSVETDEKPAGSPSAPIVTRVFRIKNANVNSIAAIIRPMVSAKALVSVSSETNQLVISDITTNVDEIANLLVSLDAPHSALDVEAYVAKNVPPKDLATLAQVLLSPFTEGNPLIFVPQPETNSLFIVATHSVLERARAILEDLDQPPQAEQLGAVGQGGNAINFYIYPVKNNNRKALEAAIGQFATDLKHSKVPDQNLIHALENMKYMKETDSLMFSGAQEALNRLKTILPMLDEQAAATLRAHGSFLIYHLQYLDFPRLLDALKTVADKISALPSPDRDLLDALKTATYLKDTNSVAFSGPPGILDRIRNDILPSIDIPSATLGHGAVYLYQLQYVDDRQLMAALRELILRLKASTSPDTNLIQALESAHYIKESNSMVFTGTTASLDRVKELLPMLDTQGAAMQQSTFFIYTPQKASPEDFQKAINQFVANLKKAPSPDTALISALQSGQFMKETGAFSFNGSGDAISQIQQILPTLDVSGVAVGIPPSNAYFLYVPKYRKGDALVTALHEMAANFKASGLTDTAFLHALDSAKWVPSSGSIAFTGDAASIDRIKNIMTTIDVPSQAQPIVEQAYFLYKLQYADAVATLAYLEQVSKSLSKEPNVQEVIKSVKVIKDNNALLLTGQKEAVDEVKKMIALYDTTEHQVAQGPNVFFIYKPKNLPPEQVLKDLQALVADLMTTGSIEPALKKTVDNIKYAESSQSLVISGPENVLSQIKTLLEEVDVVTPKNMYQVGAKTFFIYKLQYASISQLMQSLRSVSKDLKKGGIEDQALSQTIDSMTPIPETNSILFTGTAESLQKMQELIGKFDIPSMAGAPPAMEIPINFVVYRPLHKPGDELIEMLCEFIQNLKQTGVTNSQLFDAVNNLRWIPNTCSLLITGSPDAIKQVQELLKQFDIPSPSATSTTTGAIGETGFLVYKLQFHQGDDIQRALRRVATDLMEAHRGQKIPIADAIEALQWIPVTNSLLTSGSPDVLARIRELIQNLDIPLRQVFIEVLVIQTSLTNAQTIGLSWAGRAQYQNKLAGQMANLAPDGNLLKPFTPVNATTTPNAANFATPTGFDLGVIGDIILHKGKTFFSLGSLLEAIQTDNDSTVLLNPKIIAQDSNNAAMFFGFNVPFQGSLVTNTSAAITTTSSLEYRNVGHNLSITPTLGSGDIITLDIAEDISQVQNIGGINAIANSTTANPAGITTSQTTMSTRVHVPDGAFVALTGQINETKSLTRTQIPCLGGLPVIGAAFTQENRTNSRTNIIIFMRPQIVKTVEEYKRITEHQEDLFRTRASMPFLKEQFDEGIDLVKPPEHE